MACWGSLTGSRTVTSDVEIAGYRG